MSMDLIVIVSILGLVTLVGLFYLNNALEEQRRRKAIVIAELSDFTFRLQRLLDFIPSAYINKDIRLLILTQMLMRLEKLVQLDPGNERFSKRLESCRAQLAEAQTPQLEPEPPQLGSPDEANELRTLLQELSRVIESFAQAKVIPVAVARQHLKSIQQSFIEANLNYLTQMAQTARQEKKYRLAQHHYRKALAEMEKRNQNGAYDERIQKVQRILEELQAELEATPPPTEDSNSELNAGLTEMLEEQESWKKKYY